MKCTICKKDLTDAIEVLGDVRTAQFVHRNAHLSGIMKSVWEIIDSVASGKWDHTTVTLAKVVKPRLKRIEGEIFED